MANLTFSSNRRKLLYSPVMEFPQFNALILIVLAITSSVLSELPNTSHISGSSCTSCAHTNTPSKEITPRPDLSTLRLVQVVHRHGDRNRIADNFPTSPNKEVKIHSNSRGELTSVGETQGYELGKYLRSRYDGYLSQIYTPSEIRVESSSMRRCRMTARKVLDGLFPAIGSEGVWNPSLRGQRIPISTLPSKVDNRLMMSAKCAKYDVLKKEHESSVHVHNFNQAMKYFYEYLASKTGLPEVNLQTTSWIIDTLKVEKAHSLDLPEWTEHPEFWAFGHNATLMHFRKLGGAHHSEMQKLMFGPLISELIGNMEYRRSDKGHDLPKFLQYSAHDSTVTSVLDTLGINPVVAPPYATALIIELHQLNSQDPAAPDPYFVQILYRNDTTVPPFQLEIPKCGPICDLDKFVEINSPVIISQSEWHKQCNST